MEETMTVEQKQPGVFIFRSKSAPAGKRSVYLKKHPSAEPEYLCESELAEFTIELGQLDYRPYFLIEEDKKRYTLAERTLPVSGMNNFRDMGGYQTKDGRHVKWGLLYRSDHLYSADEDGVKYLENLGIHTIIDYRSADEAGKYPNKHIGNEVKTYHLDPVAHTAELSAQFTSSREEEDKNLVMKITQQKQEGKLVRRYDMVMEQYCNFVKKEKCQAVYSKFLQIAAAPDAAPLIQHCRGGKDRTGFGAVLLLGALGVVKEALVYDYMLTHSNRIERNCVKMEKYRKLTDDQDVLDYLYSLIETKPEFILASIELIEQEYGSLSKYITNELKITEAQLECLRKQYLE